MRTPMLIACLLALLLGTSSAAFARQEADETVPSPCTIRDTDDEKADESKEDDTSLAGKLGGSRVDTEELFGEPVDDALFLEYELEDCGVVFITYYEDEAIIDFTVFAPREDEEKALDEPDEADWTVSEAEQIVANLLPADADEGQTLVENDGLIMVEGFSETLENEVSRAAYDYGDNTPVYGGYSFALDLTSAGDVSNITVQLGIED